MKSFNLFLLIRLMVDSEGLAFRSFKGTGFREWILMARFHRRVGSVCKGFALCTLCRALLFPWDILAGYTVSGCYGVTMLSVAAAAIAARLIPPPYRKVTVGGGTASRN